MVRRKRLKHSLLQRHIVFEHNRITPTIDQYLRIEQALSAASIPNRIFSA